MLAEVLPTGVKMWINPRAVRYIRPLAPIEEGSRFVGQPVLEVVFHSENANALLVVGWPQAFSAKAAVIVLCNESMEMLEEEDD